MRHLPVATVAHSPMSGVEADKVDASARMHSTRQYRGVGWGAVGQRRCARACDNRRGGASESCNVSVPVAGGCDNVGLVFEPSFTFCDARHV